MESIKIKVYNLEEGRREKISIYPNVTIGLLESKDNIEQFTLITYIRKFVDDTYILIPLRKDIYNTTSWIDIFNLYMELNAEVYKILHLNYELEYGLDEDTEVVGAYIDTNQEEELCRLNKEVLEPLHSMFEETVHKLK